VALVPLEQMLLITTLAMVEMDKHHQLLVHL
jgi:hypothetical protein